jgi:hypothetical protein
MNRGHVPDDRCHKRRLVNGGVAFSGGFYLTGVSANM